MIFFFILFFPSLFFFFLSLPFLPDHILQRRYTYLRFTGQNRNGSHFHNTSQHNSLVLSRGPRSGHSREGFAGSRGTGSLLVFFGIFFIVEKMHWLWLSTDGFARAGPCFPTLGVGTALLSLPSPTTFVFHLGSCWSSATVSLLENKTIVNVVEGGLGRCTQRVCDTSDHSLTVLLH